MLKQITVLKWGTIKKCLSAIMAFVMVLTCLVDIAPTKAQAAITTNEPASVYLNSTLEYLSLGEREKNIYDFNIKKSAFETDATYSWYIRTDKGNPTSVIIDKKTGVVTGKAAGTSYIRCKIVRSNGTVLRPEATVTVINNITEVKINNTPKNNTVSAGQPVDFNRTIVNTAAGKRKATQGITRWEVESDTAKVGSVDSNGIAYPTEVGKFKIRAICFQDSAKYNLWLKDKAANEKYVTAASEWATIKVSSSKGVATATTQGQLDKALAAKTLTKITIATSKALVFTITEGDYRTKTLTVKAPNSDVNNYGIFKNISVKEIKDTTWREYAQGNSFDISDTSFRIIVDKMAIVNAIELLTKDATATIEVQGTVKQINILQPITLHISGNGNKVSLLVEEGAAGSTIVASIPADMLLMANADILLAKGSEGSTLDQSSEEIILVIDNQSTKPVTLTTASKDGKEVGAGKLLVSGDGEIEIPVPAKGPSNNTGGTSYTNVTAIGTILGTPKVGLQLTAGSITPSGAAVSYQWKISSTLTGTYTNIAGATTNKYIPVPTDTGKYIKVVVMGTGSFKGTVLSDASASVAATPAYITLSSPSSLVEAVTNDGSLVSGSIAVSIAYGEFAATIGKSDVTATNLPSGFDYTVTRNSSTKLTITITGKAVGHADADDVSNLTFTISEDKVAWATADLVTGNISIDFNEPIAIFAADLTYTVPSGGFSTTANTVTLTGSTFAAATVCENISNWVISTGSTNLTVSGITRNSDTSVTINYSLKAAGLGTGTGTITIRALVAALTSGVSNNTVSLSIVDNVAPGLSANSASGITDTSATLNFTSDDAGTYYYLIYAAGDTVPDSSVVKAQGVAEAKGSGVAVAAVNIVNIAGLTYNKAYKAYIIVEDSLGNASDVAVISFTTAQTKITRSVITGVTIPVIGAAPVTVIAETDQFTGTVNWSPAHAVFKAGYAYTATITLAPKPGYSTTGVVENFFTVTGATPSNTANTSVVYAAFPSTKVYTKAQFEAALADNEVSTITLGSNVIGNVTAIHSGTNNFAINFGTYTLAGNLNLTADNVTAISFSGTSSPAISGNLVLSAMDATVTNGIFVGGTITVNGVSESTWIELADANRIIVHDDNGATIEIIGNPEDIHVSDGLGAISITADSPVVIMIDSGANVENINVGTNAAGTTIINNGALAGITADANLNIENNTAGTDIAISGTGTVGTSGSASGDISGTAGSGIIIVDNISSLLTVEDMTVGFDESNSIVGVSLADEEKWKVESTNSGIVSVDDAKSLILTAQAPGKVAITVQVLNASDTVTKQGTVFATVLPAKISAATVTITAPVLGEVPETAAQIEAATNKANYTVTNVNWNGGLTAAGKFRAGQAYTAIITLTSKNDKAFDTTSFTPTVADAKTVGTAIALGAAKGNSITFTAAYDPTEVLAVTKVELIKQPSDMVYTVGELLSLAGLTIFELNNDGTTNTVIFTDGTAAGYVTSPAHGTVLNKNDAYQSVAITHTASGLTVSTENLVVKNLEQTAPTGLASVAPRNSINDGKITGTTTEMQYKLASASDSSYITCKNAETIGLKAGTYKVRYATKDGFNPSVAVEVVIPAYEGITIISPATKTAYLYGDALDLSGLVVKSNYSDGTTQTETISSANISGFNSEMITKGQVLTITVGMRKSTFTITVDKAVGLDLSGVTMDDITNFMIGMKSTMEFSVGDGVTWTRYNAVSSNLPSLTGNISVAVRLAETTTHNAGKATTFKFNVSPVAGVAIKTAPTKTKYFTGAMLDLTGLAVTLTKADATTEIVAFADFADYGITTSPKDGAVLAITDVEVKITVNGITTGQVIKVSAIPVYNGKVTGVISTSGNGAVSGTLTGDYNITITGQVSAYVSNKATFSGTVSGDIEGSITASINSNGIDTMSGTITVAGAKKPVRILGTFPQTGITGDFSGQIITGDVPTYVDSMAIKSAGDVTGIDFGKTLQLSVDVLPKGTSDKVAWSVWTSGGLSTDIASISDSGLFTAVDAGTVVVIAKALDGSLKDATKTITINALPIAIADVSMVNETTVQVVMKEIAGAIFTWNGTVITGSYQTDKYVFTIEDMQSNNALMVSAKGYITNNSYNDITAEWSLYADTTWFGDGSATSFAINTASGLAGLAKLVNSGITFSGKMIVLSSDLNLKNLEWTPIGDTGHAFQGTFDGAGMVISNLKINAPDAYEVGLFGRVTNGSLSNLNLKNVTINGKESVGGLVGNISGSVSNIMATNVTIHSTHWAGGLIGYAYANVSNCSIDKVTVTLTFDTSINDNGDKAGGIVGYQGNGDYTYDNLTVNKANISGVRDVGGLIGCSNASVKFANCQVSNSTITADNTTYTHENPYAGGIIGRAAGANVALYNCSATDVTANSYGVKFTGDFVGGPVNNFSIAKVYNETKKAVYTTIQAAVDAASEGDIVRVLSGTFTELVTLTKKIKLYGANQNVDPNSANWTAAGRNAETIITGGINFAGPFTANEVVLEIKGFTFNTKGILSVAWGNTPNLNNILIENNIFADIYDGNCSAVHFNLEAAKAAVNTTINQNRITNIGDAANDPSGINLSAVAGTTYITNNYIDSTRHSGIQISTNGYGDINITGNRILNWDNDAEEGGRAFRLNDMTTATSVKVNGNYMERSLSTVAVDTIDYLFVKLTAGTVDASNNYWGSDKPNFKGTNPITNAGVNVNPYYTDPDMEAGSLQDDRIVSVSDYEKLIAALADATINTINFSKNIKTTTHVVISRAVTINGNGYSFSADNKYVITANNPNSDKHLLKIAASDVIINDLTIDSNDKAYGIMAFGATGISLNDITIENSVGSGLCINGSIIVANNLNTNDNAWGAVNIDPGLGVTKPSSFTLTGTSLLSEVKQIWSDGDHVNASATVTVTAPGFQEYYNSDIYRIWTTNALTNVATITKEGKTYCFPTIALAVLVAASGDTITVYPGTYPIVSEIVVNNNITIVGIGNVIFEGIATSNPILRIANKATISGITFRSAMNNLYGVILLDTGADVVITNCIFDAIFGVHTSKSAKLNVSGSIFMNCNCGIVADTATADLSIAGNIFEKSCTVAISYNAPRDNEDNYNAFQANIIANNVGAENKVIAQGTFMANFNAYNAALAAVMEDDYLAGGWATYMLAVNAIRATITDQSTQEAVDLATSDFVTSRVNLVKAAAINVTTGAKYATIQEAVNAATASDTITIKPGTYLLAATLSIGKPIIVDGLNRDDVILVGASNIGTSVGLSGGATLRNVTVKRDNSGDWTLNSNVTNVAMSGNSSTQATTLENCYITDGRNGIYMNTTTNVVIRGNLIDNNRTGIHMAHSVNALVQNNTVTNNHTIGILLNADVAAGQPADKDVNGVPTFTANTVMSNWYADFECRWYDTYVVTLTGNNFTNSDLILGKAGEPGYNDLIPVTLGGTAVKPAVTPSFATQIEANIIK